MTSRQRWKRYVRNNPTFHATLRRGREGRIAKRVYLRRGRVEGIAFTVLDCAECGWRVYLEAHHSYGSGKPHRIRPERFQSAGELKRYKTWRTKMLRGKTVCPKCKNDTWRYVRTDVMDHGKLYSELAK